MPSASKTNILFISHEDSLTGAPILLLNLLDCIQDIPQLQVRILIKNLRGKLYPEFQKRGITNFLNDFRPVRYHFNSSYFSKIPRFIEKKIRHFKIQNALNHSEWIFLNTITLGDLLKTFRLKPHHKILSYIHELQWARENFTNKEDSYCQIHNSHHILVPSQAVKFYLENDFKVPPSRIVLFPYYIPPIHKAERPIKSNPGIFTVGMMGSFDGRKGADLIPKLLINLFKHYPEAPIRFLWKGVQQDSPLLLEIKDELQKLGLIEKIEFLNPSPDISDFYQELDVFLSLSREDPYPLVVLEAAQFGIPGICFENSGGAQEFIENCGSIIPFLDLDALSKEIYRYFTDKGLLREKGGQAYEKWKRLHGDKNRIKSLFITLMEELHKS